MEDLNLASKLFQASSKLNQASSWLVELAEGREPDEEGIKTLNWVGQFISEVDISSRLTSGVSVGGSLSIQATSVRPTFYSSVMRIAPLFQKAGFNSGEEIIGFLNRLNALLSVKGTKDHGMSQRQIAVYYKLASELLKEVSRSIMVQLSNNGLPRRGVLNQEWEPSNNQFRAAYS